ncbi:MAG: hypothetical protein VXW91_08745 [Pseudomonadota bacterium]|nr:hypothetical protein [Pseudomonadota bacterium]MEC8664895.1 hypothetical protein [Pseudomonadota bacterium]
MSTNSAPAISHQEIIEDAAAIRAAADITLATIAERRAQMDAEDMADAPLFVLAGEVHSNIAHKLHHFLVIKGLHESGENTMVGYEGPYNVVSDSFFLTFEKPIDEAIADIIHQGDDDGKFAILTEFAMLTERYGVHSGKVIRNFMLEHTAAGRLTNCFADAAFLEGELDLKDAFTRAAIAQAGEIKDLNPTSPDAMHVRNHHMVSMLMTHAQRNKPRIVYHMAGVMHLHGGMEFPQDQSLKAIMDDNGQQSLTVPLLSAHANQTHLPDTFDCDEDDILAISGLGDRIAIYNIDADMEDWGVDFTTAEDEAAYVNALLTELGEDRYVRSPVQIEESSDQYMNELMPVYANWAKSVYRLGK